MHGGVWGVWGGEQGQGAVLPGLRPAVGAGARHPGRLVPVLGPGIGQCTQTWSIQARRHSARCRALAVGHRGACLGGRRAGGWVAGDAGPGDPCGCVARRRSCSGTISTLRAHRRQPQPCRHGHCGPCTGPDQSPAACRRARAPRRRTPDEGRAGPRCPGAAARCPLTRATPPRAGSPPGRARCAACGGGRRSGRRSNPAARRHGGADLCRQRQFPLPRSVPRARLPQPGV
jgi:hypothetical protein